LELFEKCNGNVPFSNLQEINPQFVALEGYRSPRGISAFAKAAKEGRLPAYQNLDFIVTDENAEMITELLAAPWPSVDHLSFRAKFKPLAAEHEPLFLKFAAAISKVYFPSLSSLCFAGPFSVHFGIEILNRPRLELRWLTLGYQISNLDSKTQRMSKELMDAFLKRRFEHFPKLCPWTRWMGTS
jgi:hypothetical protein